jgi:hypothetical protein
MSTGRLKDQKDFDFEQIVKIIDSALESDDQRIKDALRALMTITVLCTAEHPDQTLRNGPLARVFEDYNNLARRLSSLEDDVRKIQWDQQKKQVEPFTPPYNPGSPFGPNPTTGWPGTNDPTKPKPMWDSTWSAGDDPNYKGSSASTSGVNELISELKGRL